MGIARSGARMLLEEARQRPFGGRVLQLGRQHLFFNQGELDRLAGLHSVSLDMNVPSNNITKPILGTSYLDDGTFFSEIGFSNVESLDYSTDEDPTYAHDLNALVPESMRRRYDMIYDGGTIEHVFDVRTVFRNIFELLKIGGRIVHSSPSSNHVDHGFFMFSPTLFFDYYAANGFRIHECQLFVYSSAHNDEPWSIYNYIPGCLEPLSFGGFDKGRMLGVFVSAEKTSDSTWDRIPQQGLYAQRWKDHQGSEVAYQDRRSSKPAWVSEPQRRPTLLQRMLGRVPPSPPPDLIPNKIAEY